MKSFLNFISLPFHWIYAKSENNSQYSEYRKGLMKVHGANMNRKNELLPDNSLENLHIDAMRMAKKSLERKQLIRGSSAESE